MSRSRPIFSILSDLVLQLSEGDAFTCHSHGAAEGGEESSRLVKSRSNKEECRGGQNIAGSRSNKEEDENSWGRGG